MGPAGIEGPPGRDGAPGARGPQGEKGEAGESGVVVWHSGVKLTDSRGYLLIGLPNNAAPDVPPLVACYAQVPGYYRRWETLSGTGCELDTESPDRAQVRIRTRPDNAVQVVAVFGGRTT
jgi:hypothetical protein